MATCTAPGHQDCMISCSNGCVAIYIEPSGPCYALCSENATQVELPRYSKFSVAINEMTTTRLENIIGAVLPNDVRDVMIRSPLKISLQLSSINLDEFTAALRRMVFQRAVR